MLRDGFLSIDTGRRTQSQPQHRAPIDDLRALDLVGDESEPALDIAPEPARQRRIAADIQHAHAATFSSTYCSIARTLVRRGISSVVILKPNDCSSASNRSR